jgi:THO complex subunit 1
VQKHFKQKNLIILRSCNELLRRLSRAEDTVFCGRVFIFLFQSFPLGDKSSVNLRGEYHTENVTTFDDISSTRAKVETPMEIDTPGIKEPAQEATTEHDSKGVEKTSGSTSASSQANPSAPKVEVTEAKSEADSPPLNIDELYPLFWRLQEGFSAPTQLFIQDNFESFKKGLEATITTFKNVNTKFETRAPLKPPDEASQGTKRKHPGEGEESGSNFNPKYLTSRDLFELEVSRSSSSLSQARNRTLTFVRSTTSHSGGTYWCRH